jgi:hypothetical protein
MSDTLDGAARTAETVAAQAASGNVWAFGVFVILLAAALAALWVWRSTNGGAEGIGGKDDSDDQSAEASCSQSDGCPAVQRLGIHMESLIRQMQEDGRDRRDHRQRVEDMAVRIHERIDGQEGRFATQRDMDGFARTITHSIEEMARTMDVLAQRRAA